MELKNENKTSQFSMLACVYAITKTSKNMKP